MGGSPCKAWDWRNPIVQTLFTQGATRTAVLCPRRDSRTNGRGCPSASARGSAVVPPGVLRGRRDSRNVGAGRPKAVARVGASQPPEPGLFRLWTAIYQRPASDPMGREGGSGSCPGRAEAPAPPRRGQQNRPGRAEAPAPRGGGGGRAKPARRGPLAPAMFGPKGRTPPSPPPLAYRALSLAPSLVSSTP